ncbi:MAG: N-acetyltransferase family protein [Ferruginibacter sp.]|nr:N-acetyltransferase [Ferruginibacter sp.]
MKIKAIQENNYQTVVEIYEQGIATGNATFQTEATTWAEWDKSHLPFCRIAIFEDVKMLGWAALSPVSSRCVYAGVAEVSIYVASNERAKGIGKILFEKLISESEENGLWTLQSGIFPENISSIKLHETMGFRIIGYREKIGAKNGVWRDNVIMERRSKTIGV